MLSKLNQTGNRWQDELAQKVNTSTRWDIKLTIFFININMQIKNKYKEQKSSKKIVHLPENLQKFHMNCNFNFFSSMSIFSE